MQKIVQKKVPCKCNVCAMQQKGNSCAKEMQCKRHSAKESAVQMTQCKTRQCKAKQRRQVTVRVQCNKKYEAVQRKVKCRAKASSAIKAVQRRQCQTKQCKGDSAKEGSVIGIKGGRCA